MKGGIKHLAFGTVIYGLGQSLNRLIGFLLLPLFTKYLTPEEYGVVALLALVSYVVTQISGLGFGTSLGIVYFKEDNISHKNKTIWTAFIILLCSCTLASLLVSLASNIISSIVFHTTEYSLLVVLSCFTVMLNAVVSQPFILSMQFEGKSRLFTVLNLVSTLITAGLNILFVVFLGWGVVGWVVSNLIGSVIYFLIFYLVSANSCAGYDKILGNLLLKLGLPMIPSFLFLFFIQYSGRYFLQLEKGLADVGIYNIGYTLGTISSLAVSSFVIAWYPYFNSYVNNRHEGSLKFSKIMTYYVVCFGFLTVAFFLFARPLVVLFTQPPYYQSYILVGPVALAHVFSGLFSLALPGIYFAHEVKYINVVQFVCCCIVLVLNVTLISCFGMLGAAIAMASGFGAMPILQIILNKSRGYLPVKYEYGKILIFLIIYVAAVIPTFYYESISISVNIIVSTAIMIALFCCVWNMVGKNEREQMLSVLTPRFRQSGK